jgi:hypothetical protein
VKHEGGVGAVEPEAEAVGHSTHRLRTGLVTSSKACTLVLLYLAVPARGEDLEVLRSFRPHKLVAA